MHVEQSFSMLIARFGILWRPLRFSLSRVPVVIAACMTGHNCCIDINDSPMRSPMSIQDRGTLYMALRNDERQRFIFVTKIRADAEI